MQSELTGILVRNADPFFFRGRSSNVEYGPLSTVIWWSHLIALRQCSAILFLWLVQQPGMDVQYMYI